MPALLSAAPDRAMSDSALLALLIMTLLVGVLAGMFLMAFITNAAAAQRASEALEMRERPLGKPERDRIAFDLPCDEELVTPLERPRHAAADAWDEYDETVVRAPTDEALGKRAPRGRR